MISAGPSSNCGLPPAGGNQRPRLQQHLIATLAGVTDHDAPLHAPVPDIGDDVPESTVRILEEIRQQHNVLASEAWDLFLKTRSARVTTHDIRRPQLSVLTLAQLVRRIDGHAASYLEEIIVPAFAKAIRELVAGVLLDDPSHIATDAIAVIEGALVAAYIEGPARDGTTLTLAAVAIAGARAEASAEARADATVELDRVIERAGSEGMDPEIVAELRDLRAAIEADEPRSSLIERFMKIAEAIGTATDLGESLARLATMFFG